MPVFWKEFLGWPTRITVGGIVVMLFLTPMSEPGYWADNGTRAFIELILLIEAWALPYIAIPIIFILTDALPWNRKRAGTLRGENMISIAGGILVCAIFSGGYTFLGARAYELDLPLLQKIGVALTVGAVIPGVFFVLVFVWCMFPGEG